MKKLVLLFVLFIGASQLVSAQQVVMSSGTTIKSPEASDHSQEVYHPVWEEFFKTALAKSKKQKKPILVFFTGSDWCGPCKKVHKGVFETQRFKKYAEEDFIIYEADFPRNKDLVEKSNRVYNNSLKKRFKERSFPAILIIDDNGNLVGRKSGMHVFDSYFPFFDEMIEKYKAQKN